MNVFTYWENPPKTTRMKYLDICLDSIRHHCLDGCLFHHVTASNMSKYIPDGVLHPSWKNIKELGVKSDCVRAACLFLYGGMYIDADTIMLRSPKHLDTGADFGGSSWSSPPRRVIAGYCYCRQGSHVAAKWVENINAKLAVGKHGWCELGEGCLTPAVSGNVDEWPLSTFLPVEIDHEVESFFEKHDLQNWVTHDTVGIGLNHSWMTRRKLKDMVIAGGSPKINETKRRISKLMIHRVMEYGIEQIKPMRIGVCVPTFRRPELLGHLIHAFEKQSYKDAQLIAYDDCGELNEASGKNWRIVSRNEKHPTLGAKRNAISAMMPNVDAYVFWDDDDLYLSHALAAIEHGLSRADFCRPNHILINGRAGLQRYETYGRKDKTDKAFMPSWGVTRSAFEHVGGFDDVSLGEDLLFAKKMEDAGISESDPLALGWEPYFITSPYNNEHFSWKFKDYGQWHTQVSLASANVVVSPHKVQLGKVSSKVAPRGWSDDWYKEEVR